MPIFCFPKAGLPICTMTLPSAKVLKRCVTGAIPPSPSSPGTARYVGTVSEGDFLWRLLDTDDPSMKKAEELRVRDIIGSKYPAVRITVTMDALLESAMNQNFIPVIDDLDNFIGIVTRRDIISYLAKENENSFAPPVSKIG